MKIQTWAQLMAVVKQRDILRVSKGKITQRQAFTWAKAGLPHFEHSGSSDRHKWYVKAAAEKGVVVTLAEVLKLSAEHKKGDA